MAAYKTPGVYIIERNAFLNTIAEACAPQKSIRQNDKVLAMQSPSSVLAAPRIRSSDYTLADIGTSAYS